MLIFTPLFSVLFKEEKKEEDILKIFSESGRFSPRLEVGLSLSPPLGHTLYIQKFLGQGLYLSHSSDLSCHRDNAGSLTLCTTVRTPGISLN